jgi:hypothetical protein
MWENECHGLARVGNDVDANVGDQVARLVRCLETLERNIFTALQLDKVLDSDYRRRKPDAVNKSVG